MTSNISVFVRVRPLLVSEKGDDDSPVEASTISVVDDRILAFGLSNASNRNHTYSHGTRRTKEARFAFDRVFPESATQQTVFKETTLPLVPLVLDGFDATVFAYGATGCGKTHTITGSANDPGIIHNTMTRLFAEIDAILKASPATSIEVSVSYLEVYNETIRDLLAAEAANEQAPHRDLHLREDDDTRRVVVPGLTLHTPRTVSDVLSLLAAGNAARACAATRANAASSRSHAVLRVSVRTRCAAAGGGGVDGLGGVRETVKEATLSIIDLAGSERASATQNQGRRMREGANINRSLLALGNCINALCSNKPSHIPYRDSKLTRLLKYSLSGSCKVVMIANVSPARIHFDETQNTLKYANRAKNISTELVQNAVDVDAHVAQYARIIESLRREVANLKKCLPSQPLALEHDVIETAVDEAANPVGDAADSPPRKSELQMLRIYKDLVKRVSGVYDKMRAKDDARINADGVIATNEARADLVVKFVERISTNADRCHESLLLALSDCAAAMIDKLSLENVRLRHNIGEYAAAIDRYQRNIQTLISAKANAEELSLLYREKIEAAVFELEEKRANSINCTLLEVMRKRIDENSCNNEAMVQGCADILNQKGGLTESVLADFVLKAFGLTLSPQVQQQKSHEAESAEELWEGNSEDAISECDVSLNYDSMSELESEFGDASDEVCATQNILDELEDENFKRAFEHAAFSIGNHGGAAAVAANDARDPKTPYKKVTTDDDPAGSRSEDAGDDEQTPMAKPTHCRESLPIASPVHCVSSISRHPRRPSIASSLNSTPVALSARARLFDTAAAAEGIVENDSADAKPRRDDKPAPRTPMRSLLPVIKTRTPLALASSNGPEPPHSLRSNRLPLPTRTQPRTITTRARAMRALIDAPPATPPPARTPNAAAAEAAPPLKPGRPQNAPTSTRVLRSAATDTTRPPASAQRTKRAESLRAPAAKPADDNPTRHHKRTASTRSALLADSARSKRKK
ncbi:kinesin-like protein Klp5 [Entophlyctis luteolus]|nr:kinesin-like protein Klp5 [Entophlyctis luteolus]